MTTPFLGAVGEHPSGLSSAQFRDGEICGICYENGPTGSPGTIPESCTPFETSSENLCTRIYQEFSRIFPSLRPNAHGEQTRHIFHAACLSPWLDRDPSCPVCRQPIHKDAMLSTAQKLRGEMRRHPKIWGAIGAVFAGGLAAFASKQMGLARHAIRWIEWGTAFIAYNILSVKLRN
ncbi:MAG: hypothetical protein K1X28_10245 [Parachlamydiales bacterium]|nr:hypothetical protein [Parachlamydiales bacterium]